MRWGSYGVGIALVLLMGAGPPEFRGCADGDEVPSGGALPEGEGCVRDSDCAADACMDVRCLAGACMTVGPRVDRDGDGRAPSPCGDDCDDSRPDVFVGAPERCDGRDNDCDGEIDDGAPRLDATYSLGDGDATSVLLPWGPGFLVTEATSSVLWGLPVAIDGSPGSPIELMRLTGGSRFTDVAAASAADRRLLIVTLTDLGTMRYLVLERDPSGMPLVIDGPATVPTPDEIGRMDAIAFGSGWALGYDATTPLGPERLVTDDLAAEPTIRVPLSSLTPASFGLATDGTHVVVTDDAGDAFFFLPDGTGVASHALAEGLPPRPLASWDGSVVAAIPDDFDYNLVHVQASAGLGSPTPAPFGDASDRVRIVRAGDLVIVARTGTSGTSVQALRGDLSTYEGDALALGRTGAPVARLDTAVTSEGVVGILAALEGGVGVDLGVLRACAP